MTVAPAPDPALAELSWLEAACRGRVVHGDDPAAAELCAPLGHPSPPSGRCRPAVVVVADGAHDVSAAVRLVGRTGSPLWVRGGGLGGRPSPTGGVLVSTRALDTIEIDGERRVARVGGGVTWASLEQALAPVGLTAVRGHRPAGTVAATVAVGGVGPWSRRWGAPGDSVVWLEVVTPDGRVRRVGTEDSSGLFRDARGGGNRTGIITAVEVAVRSATVRTAGTVDGSVTELAASWLAAVARWPESMSSALELHAAPPDRATVHVWHVGAEADASALVSTLAGAPQLQECDVDPLGDLDLSGPTEHLATVGADQLLRRPERPGRRLIVHLGGALGRPARWSDRRAGRDATFALVEGPTPSSRSEEHPD